MAYRRFACRCPWRARAIQCRRPPRSHTAAKVAYGTSLANVDWLHGGAESLLTITNLMIGEMAMWCHMQKSSAPPPCTCVSCMCLHAPCVGTALAGSPWRFCKVTSTYLLHVGSMHINGRSHCGICCPPESCLSLVALAAVLGLRQGIREAGAAQAAKEAEAQLKAAAAEPEKQPAKP